MKPELSQLALVLNQPILFTPPTNGQTHPAVNLNPISKLMTVILGSFKVLTWNRAWLSRALSTLAAAVAQPVTKLCVGTWPPSLQPWWPRRAGHSWNGNPSSASLLCLPGPFLTSSCRLKGSTRGTSYVMCAFGPGTVPSLALHRLWGGVFGEGKMRGPNGAWAQSSPNIKRYTRGF